MLVAALPDDGFDVPARSVTPVHRVENHLFFVTGAFVPFASHMCKVLGTLRPLFERHGALTRTQFNLVLSVGVWPSILQPFTQHVFMDPHAVGACVLSIIALIGHTAFALSFISGTADAGSAPSRFLGAVLSRALFGFAQGGLTIAQNTLCVFFVCLNTRVCVLPRWD